MEIGSQQEREMMEIGSYIVVGEREDGQKEDRKRERRKNCDY